MRKKPDYSNKRKQRKLLLKSAGMQYTVRVNNGQPQIRMCIAHHTPHTSYAYSYETCIALRRGVNVKQKYGTAKLTFSQYVGEWHAYALGNVSGIGCFY